MPPLSTALSSLFVGRYRLRGVKIHEFFDALNVQIWTADLSGALTFVNEYAARYFGRTREQLIGDGWQNVLHATDVPSAVAAWTDSLRSGEPYDIDFRLIRAFDRTYRWHHTSAVRITAEDGLMWLGSNVDVDAERRADEILRALREQMRSRSASNS